MTWSPTAIGLTLDLIGFLIIFIFGGFSSGQAFLEMQWSRSEKTRPLRILGAIMVIVGFALQLIGALS